MKNTSVKPANKAQAEIKATRVAAQAAWAKQRIAILDARLGENTGAKRERARLQRYINGSVP